MNKNENPNNYTINNINKIDKYSISIYNANFKIAIFDCGIIKEYKRQRAAKIQKILKQINIKSDIISILENNNLCNELNTRTLNQYTHTIITGSALDYDTEEKGIKYLKTIIKEIRDKQIPTLGICFGAQLIANEFGGVIEKNKSKEVGFKEIQILKPHEIFQKLQANLNVFQYHFDHIKQLPLGAMSLANSKLCHQAFIYENFLAVQFHPEIDLEFAKCESQAIKDFKITNCCETEFFRNHNINHRPELIFKNFIEYKFQ